MRSLILRYGALLAFFLIVLDLAQRSYTVNILNVDLYIGVVALIFLAFGAWLSLKLFRPKIPMDGNSDKILDQSDFSDREAEILLYLSHGFTNKEIAETLKITINTVKTHLKNIYSKLGVSNRTQAAAEAKMMNIIG